MKISRRKNDRFTIATKFANPFYDASDPSLANKEIDVIERIAGGTDLSAERIYVTNDSSYAVVWVWMSYPTYPRAEDWPINRLISRGILRTVECGGGYTRLVFTDLALKVFRLPQPESERRGAPFRGQGSHRSLETFKKSERKAVLA